MTIKSDLFALAKQYRDGNIELDQLRSWVKSKESLIVQDFSRGDLLKLKRGKGAEVLAALKSGIPICQSCQRLSTEHKFTSRGDFDNQQALVTLARDNQELYQIKTPLWFEGTEHSGMSSCYKCASCSSHWVMALPERSDFGGWYRLA